jgi:R2.llaJI
MPIDREYFDIREHCHINQKGDEFVGVQADSNNVTIYFPMGYELPPQDDELRIDIKNLFQVLAMFTEKTERVLEMDKFTSPKSVDFPIQAYLNVIDYFLEHNGSYYIETEITYKIDKRGKINWGKTIKTQMPMVQEKSFLYLNQVVRQSTPDLNRLITRIHRYCVYESFERIGWLYTINSPEQPDIFFDKNMFLSTINSKLSGTNNDNDKKLFRSMIAMIEFRDNQTIDKQLYFGTNKFETVWQRLVDKVFGVSNKSDFFPHGLWTERFGKNKGKPASALEPDTIMIYDGKFYILDAKYYRYGIIPASGPKVLPQSSDINKQITYGQFVKNCKTPDGAEVFNAFILPYNRVNNDFKINGLFGNVAEAIGDWVDNPASYERVQGIVFDTRYLLKNYDGNHDAEKEKLSQEIERPFIENKA